MISTDEASAATTDALENQFGLADRIVDDAAVANSVQRFREQGITLPTFAQLADPSTFDQAEKVGDADPQGPDARNLWRVHWYNDLQGNRVGVPEHVVLPSTLTGVASPIIVVFGDRFPMITAHKVLAAYSCLAPRVVTGQFDPTVHRAVWPSTGNYARGGIAISKIMASRGVAILPEGMSQERFDWLDTWCANPEEDVIKTHGTESNVKEIYDACNELAKDPGNFILNQFSEFGNHLGHYNVTGRALGHVFETVRDEYGLVGRDLELAAFTSATGSAGTIAAGDRLKEEYGAKIVAVEALECPTMLENGYGEHNIQGIGDKHIPLIHNIANTDVVVGISDKATDELDLTFNTEAGRAYLAQSRGCLTEPRRQTRTLRVLGDRKRPRGDQDCEITEPRRRPSADHRRHRWRRAVPERASQAARTAVRQRVHHDRCRRSRRRTSRCGIHGPHDRLHRPRPSPAVQSRLLHMGRAAGHAV